MENEQIKKLAALTDMKFFRTRAAEGWGSFLEGEAKLRSMIDAKSSDPNELVSFCSELLAPAFENICFELGFNGEKYELILTPEGVRSELFKLVYFQNNVPDILLEHWNIIVGRRPSQGGYELRMNGLSITSADVQIWPEKQKDGEHIGVTVFCKKLLPLIRDNEQAAFTMMKVFIDQVIGEIASIRYLSWIDLAKRPCWGKGIPLSALPDYLCEQIASEVNQEQKYSATDLCERYCAYQLEPSNEEQQYIRGDVFVGVTCAIDFINGYLNGDDEFVDSYIADGAVPGFLYYDTECVKKENVLNMREELQNRLQEAVGDAVTFIGGASAPTLGYLDFIAWDIKVLLDAAREIFVQFPPSFAAFHSFSRDAEMVVLKGKEILE